MLKFIKKFFEEISLLRLKVSTSEVSEDYIAAPAVRRLLPGKHLFAVSVIALVSGLFAFNSGTVPGLVGSGETKSYMTESERSYLMAAEQVVELPSEELLQENYEDYDIPLSQFGFGAKTPVTAKTPLIDAKNTLPRVAVPEDRMADLISITPLKHAEFARSAGPKSDAETQMPQKTLAAAPAADAQKASVSTVVQLQPPGTALESKPRPDGTWYAHKVGSGDSLSRIFRELALPQGTLKRLIKVSASDQSLLALNIGDELHFFVDDDNNLLDMVKPDRQNQVHFARQSENEDFAVSREERLSHLSDKSMMASIKSSAQMPSFIEAQKKREAAAEEALMAQKERAQGTADRNASRPRLIIAKVLRNENFDRAARRAGLTKTEIATIKSQVKGRFDLKSLGIGDSFRVLFNGIGTRALINAVEFKTGDGQFAIYRNPKDKGFYQEGEYVPTAGVFRRFPLADTIKITSKFNPRRRHPVTGRITPHKGIDFKAPVGTPVYAPADGTVTFAGYQRAAGYYIIIRHQGNYSTVYMHLSKMDVKKGEQVIVGQQIARTGNTGRTTGPHLHYEVRIGDRAVDPLTIELPTNSHPHLAREQREAFESNIRIYKTELYTDSLAQNN